MVKICIRNGKKIFVASLITTLAMYATYIFLQHDQNSNSKQSKLKVHIDEVEDDAYRFHVVQNGEGHKIRTVKKKNTHKQDESQVKKKNDNTAITHVAFLKVHKTASSTAQNVFLRFGASRNLSFILPHYKGESGWLNVISFRNPLTKDNVVPAPPGRHFDILCCHVVYDQQAFRKYLPKDTVYIGIVREPISRFQSAVKFFVKSVINKIKGDHPVSTYADNPLKYETADPRDSQMNNRMAVEFGFPLDLFPGRILNGSVKEVNKYLKKIDHEFKFIIISERFDESMVYIKRILNWTTKDILYIDQNISGKKKSPRKLLTESDKSKINKFLYLDNALYDFSVKRFEKQIAAEGKDFAQEVEKFREIRQKVQNYCDSTSVTSLQVDKNKWSSSFALSKSYCKLFTKHEKTFIQSLRYKMYGTLEN